MIISKTPFRVSFIGGGSDLKEYYKNNKEGFAKIIDLGCGTGSFTRRLFQNLEAELFGLDISVEAIQLAKQKEGKIKALGLSNYTGQPL